MIGRRLGHYEILEKLGQGGMGEVYRARDTRLDREVALKILPTADADPERTSRFDREARAVAALRHPNIVTIHDVDRQEGVRYLAMELVEGSTLTASLPPGGLPLSRFLEIALPLTDAVAAAHAKGITHRDLKPDNVMLDPDGRVKVLDFGLAKLVDTAPVGEATVTSAPNATQQGSLLGTVAYMSPEQAEGKPVDPRSDVFSLGIVLYEMLTGERPFGGEHPISTLTAILRDPAKPVHERKAGAPRALDRILQRCLAKSPDERYPTARELHDDLARLASGPPKLARPAPLTVGIAALVLAGVAVAAWYFGRERSPSEEAPARPMIVVFPFENLGPAADQYFAAGIADEITSRLSTLHDLGVLSRTSAVQYDRKGKTMPEIASDLGVDYVLDGTVRWARDAAGGSEVRVTPQLIRAHEDRQIWSSSYDRSMDQIFRIQSEIAGKVVDKLGVALGQGERAALEAAPTSDVEAYHAYLRGHEIVASADFSRESWERAVGLLEEATSRDPRFLRAFVDLAQVHAGFVHFAWDPSEQRLAKSKAAVDRALEIDAGSPWAQLALGYYRYWGRKDYEAASEAFSKAEAGLPSSVEVLNGISFVRRRQGRWEDAVALLKRSVALDPRNALTFFTLAETQTILRRYDDARRDANRAIELGPEAPEPRVLLARIELLAGDAPAARAALPSFLHAPGGTESRLGGFWVAIRCGDADAAIAIAGSLPEAENAQFDFECRSAALGFAYRLQGDERRAREEFERARTLLTAYRDAHPGEANVRSALGRVLAELGEKEAALREARSAMTLPPATTDAWLRQARLYDLAVVETLAGERDAAIGHLRELLEGPSDSLSPALLRSSSFFESLRGDPGFERLTVGSARP